jgi:hypothetical protein
MATKAVIGALRVDLGLNSAQFSKGLKDAQTGLGKLGKAATIGFAAVVAGAAAATAALAPLVKGAINHADALAKSAQKAGTTVEALSRLEYAAKLSDVSLESLTAGLQKLGKSMSDAIITPTSTAATAFKALGIEIKNSDGTMRNSDAVLADVADRFSRLEDGSTKTALAMQMFGKSGAELIPLLNSGRQGLKDMADESDRLGITISTKTAKAAEKFNDTLTTISQIMQGVVNKVMEAEKIATTVLPVIEGIANAAILAAKALDFLQNGSTEFQFAKGRTAALNELRSGLAADALNMFGGGFGDRGQASSLYEGILNPGGGLVAGAPSSAPLSIPTFGSTGTGTGTGAAAALKAINEEIAVMNNGLELQKQEWEDLQSPIRAAADAMGNVFDNLVDNLLSGQDAVKGLVDDFKSLGSQLIKMALNQAIMGFLGSLFGTPNIGVGQGFTGPQVYGGGGTYGIPGYVPSYDGGGFTGGGSRSGGLDGKGGFPAILHPNETVVDHTKGQGGRDFIEVKVVSEVRNGNLVPVMAEVAGQVAGRVVRTDAATAVAKSRYDRIV